MKLKDLLHSSKRKILKMPVPKGKQKLYGKIAGHMQNEGYSYEESKDIADKAVMKKPSKKKKRSSSTSRKKF